MIRPEGPADQRRVLSRRRFIAWTVLMSGVAAVGCSQPTPAAPTSAPAKPTSAPAQAAPASKPTEAAKPAEAAKPTAAAAAPAKPAADAPVPGGTFRMAFAGAPDFLDPLKSFQGESYAVTGHIYDNLTRLDPKNQPLPMLATKWTPEKSAKEWVVELREGVKWHDGKPFTSKDVVHTLEKGQDPALKSRVLGAFGPYEGVKAEGEYKVRIILQQPFADFPVAAASPQTRIFSAHYTEDLGSSPMGTGPFKLKEFQPGSHTTLVKNPDYWMKGQPYLDEVRYVVMKEGAARMAALQSGAIEAIFETPPEIYQQLEKASGVKVFSIESGSHQLIQMQANMEPFTRPEARQALRFILEREPMVKSFLFGLGSVGNDHPVINSSPFFTEKPLHKRDIEKVKGLLAQAGVQTPWNIELWTSSERPPSQKMAVAFKELAEPAGIIVDVKDVPQAVYSADVSRKKPLYTVNRFGRATLYEQVFLWFHGKAGFNYSQVSLSSKLDSLLEDMAAETDTAKRKEIVSKVIDEMFVVGHHVIPYFLNYNSALSDKVQGYWPSPNLWVDVRETWIKK